MDTQVSLRRMLRVTMERRVYLDNAATTSMAQPVREAITTYLEDGHGNPSSIHSVGRRARAAVEDTKI